MRMVYKMSSSIFIRKTTDGKYAGTFRNKFGKLMVAEGNSFYDVISKALRMVI